MPSSARTMQGQRIGYIGKHAERLQRTGIPYGSTMCADPPLGGPQIRLSDTAGVGLSFFSPCGLGRVGAEPGWTQVRRARPKRAIRSPPIPATRGGSTSERPTVSSIARTTADAAETARTRFPAAPLRSPMIASTNAAFSTWDSMRSTGMAAVWRGAATRPYVHAAEGVDGESVRGLAWLIGRESRRGRHPLGRVPLSRRRRHVARITPRGHPDLHRRQSLAFDPADPNVLYAGTWHLVWKTSNGGAAWAPAHDGMIDDSDVA